MTGTPPEAHEGTLLLTSYKIRIHDRHVRAIPAAGLDGSRFFGPGVDLRGAEALAAIDAARPIIDWLDAREPGVRIRSISVRIEGPRVLVSLEPFDGHGRPRAMRFEPPYANELRDAGREVERVVGEACARALTKRLTTRA